MNELLAPANIVLGDRTYRVKIEAKNEEHIRKTIKIINDKIVEFKTQFAGKDMQDYIAMVLVWYATQVNTNSIVEDTSTITSLHKMETLLEKSLNNYNTNLQNEQ